MALNSVPPFMTLFDRIAGLALTPSPTAARLMAIWIIPLALLVSVLAWVWMEHGHQTEIAEAHRQEEQRGRLITTALEQQVAAEFRGFDNVLKHLRSVYLHDRADFDRLAKEIIASYPPGMMQYIAVFDADGYLDYTTDGPLERINIRDREHFRVHLDAGSDKLHISAAFIGRIGGVPLVQVTRPIRDDHGRFLGIIGIPLRPDYLARQLQGLESHPDDIIFVVRKQGTFIARTRNLDEALKITLPADRPFLLAKDGERGSFLTVSAVDKTPLRLTWSRLQDWPLAVGVATYQNAGTARLEAAQHNERLRASLGIGLWLILSVIIAAMLLRLARQNASLAASEERYEHALAATGDGVWDWRIPVDTIDHNARWGEILGLAAVPAHHPVAYFAERIHPDDRAAVMARIEAALAGTAEYRSEHRMTTPNGRILWVLDRGRVVARNAAGKATRMVGSLTDISAQKAAAEALVAAKLEAEAANLAKSRFLATMSHEIRTPMNGILGMAQMLLQPGGNDRDRQDYAHTILDSGRTLLTLLNDILDLSKVEAGRLELESVPFVPQQILQECERLFRKQADRKGLHLSVAWRGPAQRYQGDPHRLRQMLSNLIGNAIKFTEQGSIRIEASETGRHGRSARLEFSVTDSGIGIPPETLPLLFQPFSQADSSTTRQFGGSGLGLSIVRRLAELMGGDISVKSTPGEGSRFWFVVRADALTDEGNPGEKAAPADTPTASDGAALQGRVLVVEDNPTNQKVIRAMLATLGLDCVIAENGATALEAVDTLGNGATLDLVLMDLQMPVMDGYQASARIRAWEAAGQRPRLPIIALSADAFAADRQRAKVSGMDDFLAKPVEVGQLAEMLRRWLPRSGSAVTRPAGTTSTSAAPADTPPPASASRPNHGNPAHLTAPLTFAADQMLEQLGGIRELAETLIDSACSEMPAAFERLASAVARADTAGAERIAHTLKGLAAQLGGQRLAADMAALDLRLKRGETIDPLEITALRQEFEALQAALAQWRGGAA